MTATDRIALAKEIERLHESTMRLVEEWGRNMTAADACDIHYQIILEELHHALFAIEGALAEVR